MITRQQLLSAKRQILEVDLPGDEKALIREITGAERKILSKTYDSDRSLFHDQLIAYSACDDDGNLLFDPVKDLAIIPEIPTTLQESIFDAALELNGLTDRSKSAEKKDLKTLPKSD